MPIYFKPIQRQFSFITTRSCFRIIFYDTQNLNKKYKLQYYVLLAINVPLENYEIAFLQNFEIEMRSEKENRFYIVMPLHICVCWHIVNRHNLSYDDRSRHKMMNIEHFYDCLK